MKLFDFDDHDLRCHLLGVHGHWADGDIDVVTPFAADLPAVISTCVVTMPDDEYQYYVHEDSDGRPKTGWFDDDDRLLDMLYQVHKTPRYDLIDRETARKIQRRLMEE